MRHGAGADMDRTLAGGKRRTRKPVIGAHWWPAKNLSNWQNGDLRAAEVRDVPAPSEFERKAGGVHLG